MNQRDLPGASAAPAARPRHSRARSAAAAPKRAFPLATFLEDPVARTASIPLVLWVCAAVVAHLAGGGGAMRAAELVRERDELRAAVRSARDGLHPPDTTFELVTDDAPISPQNVEPPKEDSPADKAEGAPDPDAVKADKPPPPPKAPEKKPEPPKPEPPKVAPKPEPPKPPPPKPLAPVAPLPAAPPPPPPPPPEMDHRQAVRQHVKKDQADNPNANRIADDANTVDKESVARARAQDQDSPHPNMGASKASSSAKDEVGNDNDEHSGSAENKKGNDKHAPGEAKAAATDSEHEKPRPPVPPTPKEAPPPSMPGMKGVGGKGAAPAPAAPPASPGGAGPASPEVIAAEKGSYSLDPVNPGGDGKSRTPGRKRAPTPFQSPVHVGAIGLGGSGLPGGPNLNLNMAGVEAAVGNEQLARERAADGAARRAAHRGKWEKNKFDKWRPAIENYEPVVQLGDTTSLNAARSAFATYLVTIHNRLHPIFAEEWLAFLDTLPKGHAFNSMQIITNLEIVLDKTTGKIVRMGVTKPSGVTAFDVAALSSVDRAGPFGKAPDSIASPDGNVYFHWEFHRDEFEACSTRNARPYIVKNPPKRPPPTAPLRKPAGGASDERSAPSGPLVPIRER